MRHITIIAEIAGGHMGDLSRCLELVQAAGAANANAVKFQFYKAHELCDKNHPDYAVFKQLEFPRESWAAIIGAARKLSLQVMGDVFGFDSLGEAVECGLDGFKIHSADLDNERLIARTASLGKILLIGTGGHKRVEIYHAIKRVRASYPELPIVLMPGHQLFPTPLEEHSLEEIRWLRGAYVDLKVEVGCADHLDGDHPAALLFPLAAVGAGATFIEKHLTIQRAQKWEDFQSAIEVASFRRLVDNVRAVESTCGYPAWTAGRQRYREKAVKTYLAAANMVEGETVTHEKVNMLRPTPYVEPLAATMVIGKPIARSLQKGEVICGNDILQSVGILINARNGSTRLPEKALKKICGKESIALLMERMKICCKASRVVLCTTERPEDDVLVDIARREGVDAFRGPNEKVAQRLLLAAEKYSLDHIVRVTGDDLLRDTGLINEAILAHLAHNADYTCMENVVYGGDSEIISRRALAAIAERAVVPENTEFLSWFLDDLSAFVTHTMKASTAYSRPYRLSLDTAKDYEVLNAVFMDLYTASRPVELLKALDWLDHHPVIAMSNQDSSGARRRESLDLRMWI